MPGEGFTQRGTGTGTYKHVLRLLLRKPKLFQLTDIYGARKPSNMRTAAPVQGRRSKWVVPGGIFRPETIGASWLI